LKMNFALIGAAGYVAPKHMKAVRETGNNLVTALDKSDSVGILDSFAYDIAFFTEFERFDRYAEKLRRADEKAKIDYVSICSPNYLHDAHIRFALRIGANAICEKPLVLNPWNLDALKLMEQETGKKVYTVLQLRVHPSIIELKNKLTRKNTGKKRLVDLTYITSWGKWYFHSWKGDIAKSGGIATNIGIHFFDMLIWLFGKVQYQEVHLAESKKMAGFIELDNAIVRWFLSVDHNDLPRQVKANSFPTYRSITVDDKEIEFSGGFTDLHTLVYKDILAGKGYGIEDARPSLNLVSAIRNTTPGIKNKDGIHPFVLKT
jgi:UDP-N-acetyl-2-amino-2-deoxyglucuronate dehydrogenase